MSCHVCSPFEDDPPEQAESVESTDDLDVYRRRMRDVRLGWHAVRALADSTKSIVDASAAAAAAVAHNADTKMSGEKI